ncbi:MAG: S8 family serine peptidase, partial [Candidatus Bathyarchaeia archaeon]
MRKSRILICLCIISILTAMLLPSIHFSSAAQSPRFVQGEVIIGLKEEGSIQSFRSLLSPLGATVKRDISQLKALVVKVAPGAEDSFIQNVKGMPEVAYVERNGIGEATLIPSDTNWNLQWNMPMVKANASWDTCQGSSQVVIAIIDTGIKYDHPDLAANYKAGGNDWVNDDFDPMDDHSHGTHCAGIAAAVTNNALGVAGVAPLCKIWAEKVLDSGGYGNNGDLASGIVHATDKGVNVISMSLGNYPYSTLVENAVNYAYNKGVVLVGAAGNDYKNIDTSPSYPASYTNVIAVSATNSADNFDSSYSNYGNKIEVSAPGT